MRNTAKTMKAMIPKILTVVFTLLVLTNYARASEVELTENIINAWMDSQSALEEWGREHHALLEAQDSPSDTKDPTDMTPESMITPLKNAGLYDSANKLIQGKGFSNIEEWASVTLRITKAAAAIELAAHPDMLDSSQLEALRKVEGITPEQKQILSNAIERNQEIVRQILSNSSKADQTAIKPYLDRILNLMEEPY